MREHIRSSDLREQAHRLGMKAFRAGDYPLAIESLTEALNEYGPHVALLSDLVGAYYHSGDMALFEVYLLRLEQEFERAQPFLSQRSRFLTLVALAKFSEERASLSKAMSYLTQAEEILEAADPLLLRVQMQRLRLVSWLGREEDLADSYRTCLGLSEQNPQLYIECEHALITLEARLFGMDLAFKRFVKLAERDDLQKPDLALCLFDLLEIALERRDKNSISEGLQYIHRHNVSPSDFYESQILLLANHQKGSLENLQWADWMKKLSPMGRLRICSLALIRWGENSTLKKHLLFQIQSQDHRTRELLSHKWKSLLRVGVDQTLSVHLGDNEIYFENRKLSFSKSPVSWDILCEAVNQEGCSPDELLIALGKSEANEHELESLRVGIVRLNLKLSRFLGLSWVIKHKKCKISLNPAIRWALRSEASA